MSWQYKFYKFFVVARKLQYTVPLRVKEEKLGSGVVILQKESTEVVTL